MSVAKDEFEKALSMSSSPHLNRRALLKATGVGVGIGLNRIAGPLNSGMARAQDDERGTLTLLSAEPFFGSWDPSSHTILANIHAEWNCFDRLIALDWDTKELKPQLAESWEYVEPTVLEIKLRQGVVFHDGTPMTSKDVKASIDYMTNPEVAHSTWYQQFTTEIVDDYTVRMVSEEPYLGLLYTLPVTAIMTEADVLNPAVLAERYNGTGPYKWKSYSQETLEFEANDDYWGGVPGLAGFRYQYVADPGTRLAALQTGEAHVIERVESEQIPEIESNPDLRVDKVLTTENKWLIFKAKMPHMDNMLLRQAIAYAIDRDLNVETNLEGHGRTADAHHATNLFSNKQVTNNYTYDPEKAKALLAAAGFPNGDGLDTLTYVTSVGFYPKTREYGQYITQALEEIGLSIDFQAKEPAAWLELLYAESGAHLFDTGWMPPGIEPNLVLRAFFYKGGRITWYDDETLNSLLDKQGSATSIEEREAIIADELLPELMSQVPALPLFTSELIGGVSNKAVGFKANPNSTWDLLNVTVEG